MITLLNKIFPEDISQIIYKFYLQKFISSKLLGKLFNNELLINNFVNQYNNCKNKEIFIISGSLITNIYKNIKFIKEHFIKYDAFNFDNYYKSLLNHFCIILADANKYETHILFKGHYENIINYIKYIK